MRKSLYKPRWFLFDDKLELATILDCHIDQRLADYLVSLNYKILQIF